MFGAFSFFIVFGYRKEYCERDKYYRRNIRLIAFLISVLYGALTELLQIYIFIGRYGSIYDFSADVIGCVLGVFIFRLIFRKKIA